MRKMTFEERYEPITETGCWIWTAACIPYGYGVCPDRGKRFDLAHRVSYRKYKGEIPDGMFVLHSCDTPSCVNPDHLFLGTHTDNMKDMAKKGRNSKSGCFQKGHGGFHYGKNLDECRKKIKTIG